MEKPGVKWLPSHNNIKKKSVEKQELLASDLNVCWLFFCSEVYSISYLLKLEE